MTLLLPLYYRFWGAGRDVINLIPFYTRIERPDGSRLTSILGPLYISRERGDTIRRDFLWPIFRHTTTPETTEFSMLWKVLTYRSDPEGVEMRFVHYLVLYKQTDDRVLFEFNPLFQMERTAKMTYVGLLGGLLSVTSRPSGTDIGLLWFVEI